MAINAVSTSIVNQLNDIQKSTPLPPKSDVREKKESHGDSNISPKVNVAIPAPAEGEQTIGTTINVRV